jgi:pimeloyl-ACP methyl ester carboxylesterase
MVLNSLSIDPQHTHTVALGVGAMIAIHLLASHPTLVATFTGISFSVPNTQNEGNVMICEWVDRVELAQRWGMRITADKAVARWMDPSLRATMEWENIRDMVRGTSAEAMEALTPTIKQWAGSNSKDRKSFMSSGYLLLQSLNVASLFIAGSNDFGTISEDMKGYPTIMQGDGCFIEVERSGRLPWWEYGARQRFMTLLYEWIERDILYQAMH